MEVVEAWGDEDRVEFWYEYHWWTIYHNPHALRQAG